MKNLNGLIIYLFLSLSFVGHSISAQKHITWEIFDSVRIEQKWSDEYNCHYEVAELTDTLRSLQNIEVKISGYLFFEDAAFKNTFLSKDNGFVTNCIFNIRDMFDIIELEFDQQTLLRLSNDLQGKWVTLSGTMTINEKTTGHFPFLISVHKIEF
jgi:hypothetical protein